MTSPNADEPVAPDPHGDARHCDVWTPTTLHSEPEPVDETTSSAHTPPGGAEMVRHRMPEPPWRAADLSRTIALADGLRTGADGELADLRAVAAEANERLARQRALLDQLDRQLADAHQHATAQALAARRAELRAGELARELARAHDELHRLHALDLARTDRILAHVDDHHRSLVATLRAEPALREFPGGEESDPASRLLTPPVADVDTEDAFRRPVAPVATNPTLLALHHWLAPDDALLVVDGDGLAAAISSAGGCAEDAPDTDREHETVARRSAAVALLRAGLDVQASRSAIVFEGSVSAATPESSLVDPEQDPRVLVTNPGVDPSTAVGALIGHDDVGPVVLAHDSVAAAGLISTAYRLTIEELAEALAART